MEILYRSVNRLDLDELRQIAEKDSKIPKLYDENFSWDERSVQARVDLYQRLSAEDDFFEVATAEGKVIGFHVIKQAPYPPNLSMGMIITLWVDAKFRERGVASTLKKRGEAWAKSCGIDHLQTGVHPANAKMLSLNEKGGFQLLQLTLKKKL